MQIGDVLDPATLVGERWFATPDRPIRAIVVEDRFDFGSGSALVTLRVELEGGREVMRSVPIVSGDGQEPWLGLLELVRDRGNVRGAAGTSLAGNPARDAGPLRGRSVRPLGRDQSHTSVVIDDALLLKLYRAMRPGLNTEIELGAALVGDPGAPVPTYRGEVSLYRTWAGRFERHVVALVHDFVPDAGDAFEDLADRLAAWLRAGAPPRALRSLVVDAAPAGRAAARLHVSLAAIRRRHFAPRPARPQDIDRWSRRAARAHRAAVRRLRPVDRPLAAWLTDRGVEIDRALEPLAEPGARTLQRIHADLHLGQLLRTGDEFLIVDFEGEPTRSVVERRRLDTPLRDLASMLRSFDHVARSGMRRSGTPLDQVAAGTSAADPAVDAWLEAVRAAFLDAYRAEAASRGLHVDIDRALLHALEVEKELYEFGYAATYLPAWMYAPSAGMRWLLDHLVDA